MDVHAIADRPLGDLAGDRDAFLNRGEMPAGVRPVVRAAWHRSQAHGVNPAHPARRTCDPGELAAARIREAGLLSAAEPSLRNVHLVLASQPHAIALTDIAGRVLRLLTGGDVDDVDNAALEARLLREGASWHERDIGCNAVGTALATDAPIMMLGPEHYHSTCAAWTTIGVPLHDVSGTLTGALGLWLPNGRASSHTWGWMLALGQAVEARMAATPADAILHSPAPAHDAALQATAAPKAAAALQAVAAREPAVSQLRFMIENAPHGTFLQDRDLRYTWAAGASAPFPATQCTGRTDFDLVEDPADARMLTELKRSVLRHGRRTTAELSLVVEGVRRYFHATYEPARDSAGAVVGLVSHVRDTTDERRTRDALREGEARFRTLADTMPHFAWMADANGWISWYNERWYEYTGLSLGECEGWGWTRVHHPDHVERVKHRIRHSWQTGEPWEDTFPLQARDGSYRWFLSRALPIRDADGRVVRWFGTHTDVTDRLAAEAARSESEDRLRRITESGMVGVLYWELQGRVSYANRYVLDLLGYTESDVDAGLLDWRRITPPEWATADEAAIAELTIRGATTPFEKEFLTRDGRRVPVLLSAATYENDPERGITLVADMTERRRAALELERLYEEAARAVRQREEVIGFVSHDLRNPLSTIAMASSLLLEPGVAAERKAFQADVIRRAVEQMSRLIQDLLDVARLGASRFRLDLASEQPIALVHAALQLNSVSAEAAGVRLQLEVQAALPAVRADRQRVLQVFSNLIANAVEHTPRGGSAILRAYPGHDDCVAFSVVDTGVGIPADEQPFVFDRFWQGRRGGSGSGLGLTICRGIVEAHGGHVRVESEVGRGTAFTFTLPTA
jgi:PAS domain S-box-containing protein